MYNILSGEDYVKVREAAAKALLDTAKDETGWLSNMQELVSGVSEVDQEVGVGAWYTIDVVHAVAIVLDVIEKQIMEGNNGN